VPDTLCRLAVHAPGPDEPATAELVLPATRPLGELLPSIVDAVVGSSAPARHWYLCRVAGAALDTSLSLRDNAVHDGDVVLLATVQIARPRRLPTDSCAVVAAAADTGPPTTGRAAVLTAGLMATGVSAAALVRSSGHATGGWPLWCAAALAVAAATGSVAVGRTDNHAAALLTTAAVIFGCTTGILATSGASWQATFLLTTAVALAISVVLLRMTGDDAVLTALVASAGATSAAAAVCATVAPRPEAAGAVLALVSLGALSLAPTFTAAATGLGPSHHKADERRAAKAHRILTGLVAGWSASAALGAAVVAAAAVRTGSSAVLAAVFAADVGMVLTLRQRSHVGTSRRAWLGASGAVTLLVAALVAGITQPAHGFWICAATAAACGGRLQRPHRSEESNPLVRRAIQTAEYLALAALVPLAFWVTGLYGLVRDASLP
jgi:type VII secretion integral membrane protein EccD